MKQNFIEGLCVGTAIVIAFIIGGISGYTSGVKNGRAEGLKPVAVRSVEASRRDVGATEICSRVAILSCVACHVFPSYVTDFAPEIWEEDD